MQPNGTCRNFCQILGIFSKFFSNRSSYVPDVCTYCKQFSAVLEAYLKVHSCPVWNKCDQMRKSYHNVRKDVSIQQSTFGPASLRNYCSYPKVTYSYIELFISSRIANSFKKVMYTNILCNPLSMFWGRQIQWVFDLITLSVIFIQIVEFVWVCNFHQGFVISNELSTLFTIFLNHFLCHFYSNSWTCLRE